MGVSGMEQKGKAGRTGCVENRKVRALGRLRGKGSEQGREH